MIAHGACPWVGLRPFGIQDEPRFFGRAIEIREVAELWQANRVTLLTGDSGIGKTSLLHAGVEPYLANSGAPVVPIGDLRYRRTLPAPVITARGRAVFALLSSWQPATDPARSVGLTIAEFFRRRIATTPPGAALLVAIDAPEAALRQPGAARHEYRNFRNELEAALQAFPQVHLLLSVRPECLAEVHRLAGALGVTPAQYELLPLDRQSAIEALTRPLLGSHLQFDTGVPARLVDTLSIEHGTSGAVVEPAMLQALCAELWEGVRRDESFSGIVQKMLDDMDGTLAAFCTRTLLTLTADHGLPDCEIGGWMRRTFTMSPDGASPHVAKPAPQSDRPEEISDTVVRAVEDRHLLKRCRLASEDGFQLQHPRLASALQRLREKPIVGADPTAAELVEEAEQAMTAGNLGLAEKYARAALAMPGEAHGGNRIAALFILGDVASLRAEHETARESYNKALELKFGEDPKSPTIAYLFAAIARLHLLQGDTDNALGNARGGRITSARDTIIIPLELGQALWYDKQYKAAIKELNAVLDRDPDNCEALRIRGEIYADWGKSQQARKDLGKLTTVAPPSARAAHVLAVAPHASVARSDLDELREEGRTHGMVLLNLARAAHLWRDRNLAAELAGEALQATNPYLSHHHRVLAEKIARKQ
ncbi:nSTAND1 domain-containing NTPase [Nonomuraea fuscirosea]|uniref:nSTAND1 domain-containing NTPase n=1 Tax=Nonomuraea fuscirosea TaxID=1291556 RepID=UPI0033D48EA0